MCNEIEKKNINEKVRKVFLDDLPRWKEGKNKGSINWPQTVGCKVSGVYEGLEFEVEIINYLKQNNKNKLILKYLDKDEFKIQIDNFKDCKLGKLLGKITNDFKVEIGQMFKDSKRNIIIIDRAYKSNKRCQNQKWYKYRCLKCKYDEGWIIENSLIQLKNGCSCCDNKTVLEGVNSIVANKETHWMIKFFLGGYEEAKLYTAKSNKSIKPMCCDCGRIKDKEIKVSDIYKNHSIGCSCSDGQSYPFKFMFNVLEQLKIKFKTEYSPKWIKPKRYDFYFELNNIKYIVEMDGGFHNKTNTITGQTAEESKKIDNYKDKTAFEHGIEVIRIDCFESDLEYIKNNILKSKLAGILSLTQIKWEQVEEFSVKSLVKIICEIKHNNTDMTTTEIANMTNLSVNTIRRYLKKGTKIWGWVKYDPKEEMRRMAKKNVKYSYKPIEIFKDDISLGRFENMIDLENQSEEKFGVKLSSKNIPSVCKGKIKLYKGYAFKYI